MNWKIVQGNWTQLKGEIKERWGKLTDDDLDLIAGEKDKLLGRLRKRYGILEDEAEMEVDDFLNQETAVSERENA
jgi:uncharacterized protein YjbJ (UPF0337 family)